MPHAFDTSLASPQRTLVLNGIVSLLNKLLRTANPAAYLQAVIPYGSVVRSWTDDSGTDDLMKALNGRGPAIAVALGDRTSKPVATGGFHYQAELEVLVYHYNNNQRGLLDGRLAIDAAGVAANTADPGIHVMLEHAEELIVGQRCGINQATAGATSIKQVRPEREEELRTDERGTLWLQTYKVALARTINEHRTVTQMLDSIRWRTAIDPLEVKLPAAPTKEGTLDAYRDNLPP